MAWNWMISHNGMFRLSFSWSYIIVHLPFCLQMTFLVLLLWDSSRRVIQTDQYKASSMLLSYKYSFHKYFSAYNWPWNTWHFIPSTQRLSSIAVLTEPQHMLCNWVFHPSFREKMPLTFSAFHNFSSTSISILLLLSSIALSRSLCFFPFECSFNPHHSSPRTPDRFRFSFRIFPTRLGRLLGGPFRCRN